MISAPRFTLAQLAAAGCVCSLLSACAATPTAGPSWVPSHQFQNPYYSDGAQRVKARLMPNLPPAKNIILFVGDGMGVSTVTAARILDGQQKGMLGEENNLSFDHFPYTGMQKTYNVDAQTPDSAGTMTAMISGVKTDAGVLGVDADINRGQCSTVAGNELITALELAELAGKATGIVSTARITHATPAATYAKSADRNWEDDSDMPAAAIEAGCQDIALQLIQFADRLQAQFPHASQIDGIDVIMGGGRRSFLPHDARHNSEDATSEIEGDRLDGRNLTSEWQSLHPNGIYVTDKTGFDAINPETSAQVFGLFNESHMQYEADRHNDKASEPSLSEMTAKAIALLSKQKNGYFLTVESGRIDHGHHAGSAYAALTDTIELSKAIQIAVDTVDLTNTLILVTADHSHVFTMAGYPKRGNPILGKVVSIGSDQPATASDGLPYTTLGYANGLGFRDHGSETNADSSYKFSPDSGRKDLTDIATTASGYHQEALVPLNAETHGGEDVVLYAIGAHAYLVGGTHEQSILFHIMNAAGNLDRSVSAQASNKQ